MSWSLLALASSVGLAACIAVDEDGTLYEGPPRHDLGMVVVGQNPGPDTPIGLGGVVGGAVGALPTCVQDASQNPFFQCLWQGLVQGGGVAAMRDAALACGCQAEIVVTGTQAAACNVERVAIYCSGPPSISAVSPVPAGEYPCPGVDMNGDGEDDVLVVDDSEPPFAGIHINPEANGRLCDVSILPNGPIDRAVVERCNGCHKNNAPNWEPTVVVPQMQELGD